MLTFADAIIEEQKPIVFEYLRSGIDVNQIDQYGFTPLIEAAVVNNTDIAKMLVDYGANVNLQDMTGNTALHWAAENNNMKLAKLLLNAGANSNAYNFAGQPVLVMPLLRGQTPLKNLLMENGANLEFAQDYINTKLLGHMFELLGSVHMIDPKSEFVEIDFEGFYLEFSLSIIAESLDQFIGHFAARKLRQYNQFTQLIVEVIRHAAQLIKFQQYQIDRAKYQKQIDALVNMEPLIIPIGYEGHAITFIKIGDILVKCDRREESRLYDNVMIYHMNQPKLMTPQFIKNLIYEKQSGNFINRDLHYILGLQPITELKIAAQITGNCSWANVEACIPVLFFLLFSKREDFQEKMSHYKNIALNFFHEWRDWNKARALDFCIQSFQQADSLRKACKAEILGAILFQSAQLEKGLDPERLERIMAILTNPQYEYILKNYIKTYLYEDLGEEGKRFRHLLKSVGYL